MKSFGLSIESILSRSLALPSPESDCDWEVEEQGEMRCEFACRPLVHQAQYFKAESACVSLIGYRGVYEPVAYHNHAAFECRLDDMVDMLTTGCKNDQGFCFRSNDFSRTAEQDVAQPLRDRGTSWFSRVKDFVALCSK